MPKNQDRRQREVEELRRLVVELAWLESTRLAAGEVDQAALEEGGPVQRQPGSGWFEPIQPDPAPAPAAPATGGHPQPGTLIEASRRTPRAWLLLALAVGMVLGFALGSVRAGGERASAAARRPPAGRPAQAPQPSVVVRQAASSACLETARRGDQLIQLLLTNQRDRAADLLVAYTVASRQCHKDAAP